MKYLPLSALAGGEQLCSGDPHEISPSVRSHTGDGAAIAVSVFMGLRNVLVSRPGELDSFLSPLVIPYPSFWQFLLKPP
jgi:hypothetical protein